VSTRLGEETFEPLRDRLEPRAEALPLGRLEALAAVALPHELLPDPCRPSIGILAGGADLIAADEPTAELDTASATALVDTIGRLVDAGVTFVIASHDRAVTSRADGIVRLEHGSVHRPGRRPVGAMSAPPPGAADDGSDPEPVPGARPGPPPADDDAVSATDVTKTYRRGDEDVHALVDVDLGVRTGQSVALVGRSGSGKTTLLNIAAGWESPDSGQVRTLGADAHATPPGWRDVAVVPQRLGLLRELTIRENVEHPFRLASREIANEDRARVRDLLEELGIEELAERRPVHCSLGEQQRAAIARALVVDPRLLVADEPTAHLDAISTASVFDAIGRRVRDGMTFLVATHDPDVLRHVDRIVPMRDGRIVEESA